jgi:hypothetical protein
MIAPATPLRPASSSAAGKNLADTTFWARAIEWSCKHPRSTSRRSLYEREARAERASDETAYDVLDDAVPAFHKQPFIAVL